MQITFRRTSKTLLHVVVALLLLIMLAAALTQTNFARRIILNELVKTIERTSNGTLTIKSIDGDIFTGFILHDVSLKLKTGTAYDSVDLIHAERVLAQYNVWRYLRQNQLGITSLIVQRPVFSIIKLSGDTTWNFSLLTKKGVPAKQSAPQRFDQIVDLESFRIEDGTIKVRDFNFPLHVVQPISGAESPAVMHRFDWSNIKITNWDLDGKFYAKGADAQSLTVDHVRLKEETSGFFVNHLSFSGYIDSLQARMDNAQVITGHSNIGFSVELVPPTFGKESFLESLENAGTSLRMKGPWISTYELKQFLPSLDFLGGVPGIDLGVSGKLGALKVERLDLDFKGKGDIAIAGMLYNLHHPDSLSMDLDLVARSLSNSTVRTFVPGLGIPDLSKLGIVNIPKLKYIGEPLKFRTELIARTTGAGDIKGDVALDLRNHAFIYKTALETRNLDLSAILLQPAWQSNLSAILNAQGSGTDWRTLTSIIDVRTLGPSSFQSYHTNSLNLKAKVDHGTADIYTLQADMPGGPLVDVKSAFVDFRSPKLRYTFDGTIKNFPVAQYVHSPQVGGMRLDIVADVAGVGTDFEAFSGKLDIKAYNLSLDGQPLKPIVASLSIAPAGQSNALVLHSDIADIDMNGRFRVRDLTKELPARIEAITTAFKERYFPNPAEVDTSSTIHSGMACGDSVDMNFGVKIKDLRPLAFLLPKTMLLATGNIQGSLFGCSSKDLNLIASGDSLGFLMRSRRFVGDSTLFPIREQLSLAEQDSMRKQIGFVKSDSGAKQMNDSLLAVRDSVQHVAPPETVDSIGGSRINLTKTIFSFRANGLTKDPKTVLRDMSAHVEFRTDSLARYASTLLYQPQLYLDYKNAHLTFDAATVFNDNYGLRLAGGAQFPNGDLDLTLDTMHFVFKKSGGTDYRLTNDGSSHIKVTHDGLISVDTVTLIRPVPGFNAADFAPRLQFGGAIKGDTILGLWAHVPNMDIEKDLRRMLPPSRKLQAQLADFTGRIQKLDVNVSGTLQHPEMMADLAIDQLKYGEIDQLNKGLITFDTSVAHISYKDETLRGNMVLHVDSMRWTLDNQNTAISSQNRLNVQIDSIPMLISFKNYPGKSQDSLAILQRPLSAHVEGLRFPINVVGPFIPALGQLSGFADINFSLNGTQANIQYGGSARITDGTFLLTGNNLFYNFDGAVAFNGKELRLQDIRVRNLPIDDPNGEALVRGFFNFKGFSIEDFDLALRSSRLTVLQKQSQQALKNVWGPLTISTGGRDLHWLGTLDDPLLTGKIIILSSYLNIAPTAGATAPSNDIIYRTIIEDTTTHQISGDTSMASQKQIMKAIGGVHSTDLANGTNQVDDRFFPKEEQNVIDIQEQHERDSIAAAAIAKNPVQPTQGSLLDRMQYDLSILIQGDAWIVMSFTRALGLLGEQLTAELKSNDTIHFTRVKGGDYQLNGEIALTSNSQYRFYKVFNITKGLLKFTGDPTNPDLDVVAEYIGPHQDEATQVADEVKVEISLKGTRNDLHFLVTIYEGGSNNWVQRGESPEDAQEDAIYYLVSGKLKSELGEGEQIAVLQRAGTALTSQLATTMINNLFASTSLKNVIRSVSFEGGHVRLTAAYRNISLRYSGDITKPGTSYYTIEIPITSLANYDVLKKLLLQVDVHQSDDQTQTLGLQQPTMVMKLLWRIPL